MTQADVPCSISLADADTDRSLQQVVTQKYALSQYS